MCFKCFFGHTWLYSNLSYYRDRYDYQSTKLYANRTCSKCGIKEHSPYTTSFGEQEWFRVE